MSRYIDADKLTVYFEALAKQAKMEGLYNMAHVHNRCLRIIKDAPTANVVEVMHGEWRKTITGFICSVCDTHEARITSYCPNCGAKMDGERREE